MRALIFAYIYIIIRICLGQNLKLKVKLDNGYFNHGDKVHVFFI